MPAKLIATEGPAKGTEFNLIEGDEWIIGRNKKECKLVLNDPASSDKHVLCRSTPEGYSFENLNLSNAITVNDEVLEEPQILEDGAVIKIGDTLFTYLITTDQQIPDSSIPFKAEDEGDTQDQEDESVSNNDSNNIANQVDMDQNMDITQNEKNSPEDHETEFSPDIAKEIEVAFEIREESQFLLKVISGPNIGAELPLEIDQTYLIGTDPALCDVVFHDISVSPQHLKLTLKSNGSIEVIDQESLNGAFINGIPLEDLDKPIQLRDVITIGTTSFSLFDRSQTGFALRAPLIPSSFRKEEEKLPEPTAQSPADAVVTPPPEEKPSGSSFAALMLVTVIVSLFMVIGIGTAFLFRSEAVVIEQPANLQADLEKILSQYPSITYTYNKGANRLLLLGHILTVNDRAALLYKLRELKFIQTIDDNIIVDEFVWQEVNLVLGKNPQWQGITVHASSPGQFEVTGFLDTKQQADSLASFLNVNFPYNETLTNRVSVEENIVAEINSSLQERGLSEVRPDITNGELVLTGTMGYDKAKSLQDVIAKFKTIPGLKGVKSFVVETAPEESMINLSGQYSVSGYTTKGDMNVYVVIDGKLRSRGEKVDGLTITSITPTTIFLEKDGLKYRIDYNK
jgi:type III secretion system YscD/HrpQ family protein